MNLPNKLTILRVIMIPFFLIFMLTDIMGENGKYVALVLFAGASFTDFLDGYLARKYKLVTNFGKFMDPLADKLLVSAALISFVELGQLPAWIVITIISREFIISGFRLVASDSGVVIAASYWGKFKTVSQMIMIILLIIDIQAAAYIILENIFIYLALILTVVSLIDYLIKNKNVLSEGSNK
ncbi:CDP-diacylglycerol--glycerol-3-phosphate 3-phosphatidyltransferase [Konateibacter massiliensis]|uniref:CDP-diacylglycerol--glycerol-3-phosphate 3-phosphatidyltransferase n=1 Tax=Konateibacter massiliensis TaxID=2002841 RepID=UPI000C149770|nr:CDP-diacylglycerol--glycerol-3-phosphate 3-phosphatidyltransferase [Konateibacter massiliensis]